MKNTAPYSLSNTPKNNSLSLSWKIAKKQAPTFKSLLNRAIHKAPIIRCNSTNKLARISHKAHMALNTSKGTKALYLLG